MIRILLVEDDADDAELLEMSLASGELAVRVERVERLEDLRQALRRRDFDLIISDFNLPGFTGLDALAAYRQESPNVPFLLVSGTIGEEAAVACLKAGAHDYVMKRSLHRLAPAISRAIREFADRAALRAYQERYEQIVEQASEGIWIMDAQGKLVFANRKLAEILQRQGPLSLGFPLLDLFEEADRKRIESKELQHPITVRLKTPCERETEGRTVWASLSVSSLNTANTLGMLTDLTFTKQLESQLLQAQKMEALGRLAGGIAHDFNNLLSTIIGFTEIGLEEMDPNLEARSSFQEVLKAARRGAALTRQLLIVGRRQAPTPEIMAINFGVEELIQMLHRLVGSDIKLEVQCEASRDTILLDRTAFAQVVMNLVINGRDAMPGGGTIRIRTSNNPAGRVLLSVQDEGTGMSPEVQASIFEPFFTTKEAGKGTGLGLSTVFGIVQQSGGSIEVDSKPGLGSRFTLTWPVGEDNSLPVKDIQARTHLSGNHTVLVVEDHDDVRHIFVSLLERNGYQVLQASDGQQALKVEEAHSGPIDLLLSDVMMPGLKGSELAQLLQERRPGLRVILISGFGNWIEDCENEPDHFLDKPVEAHQLLGALREVLGSSRVEAGTIKL